MPVHSGQMVILLRTTMKNYAFPKLGAMAKKMLLQGDLNISVQTATRLMYEKGINSLVIEEGMKRRIFSVEDMLSFVRNGGDRQSLLSTLAIQELHCLSECEQVLVALQWLKKTKSRYVGVLNSQQALIGIVSYTDILSSIDPAVLMAHKNVGSLMTRQLPVTFTADWILEDVVHHLKKIEDAIIVVDEHRPIGIITTKDILNIMAQGQAMNRPLASYMTSPVNTVLHSSLISEVLLQLKDEHYKRAIVVDDEKRLLGVLTQSEIIGFAYGSWIDVLKNHTAELLELVGMLKEKTQGLEKLVITDELTGLGNRRLLHQRIQEEIERIQRYNTGPCSLVIVDVDHFKNINDRFGHLVGDDVLKAIAHALDELVRKNDVAVRWGGEEFAVLLTHTTLSDAVAFAERFRGMVEQLNLTRGITITVSAGVAEYLPNEAEAHFFQRVDRALYRAKDKGRNLVEFDEPPQKT